MRAMELIVSVYFVCTIVDFYYMLLILVITHYGHSTKEGIISLSFGIIQYVVISICFCKYKSRNSL